MSLVLALVLVTPVLYETARQFRAFTLQTEHRNWELARRIQARGLDHGAPIAVIGNGMTAFWARLGRFRIVAEIPPPQNEVFWSCDPTSQREVLNVLASTGAVAVIAVDPPAWARTDGWDLLITGGPLISTRFTPRPRDAGLQVPPSYLDYRQTSPCSPTPLTSRATSQ
jgi:hypothetical protein